MSSIDPGDIFKLSFNIPKIPKEIYLIEKEGTVLELFQDAFIIPKVKWNLLYNMWRHVNKDLDLNTVPHSRIAEASDILKKEKEFPYKDYLTVIPFTPEKEHFTDDVTDWKIPEEPLIARNASAQYWRFNPTQADSFYKVLLENADVMSILLRGVHYDSPCKFCKFIFSRISGECQIYDSDSYREKSCQPRISFASKLIIGEDYSLEEQVDYAKAFTHSMWDPKNFEKIEV